MEPTTERAIATATAVAENHGLTITGAKLIGGYSNTIVKLNPLPLVARIATASATVRIDDSWLSREVEIAKFLSRHLSNSVRPSDLLPPGPHRQDGMSLSYWEFLEVEPSPTTPKELGSHLNRLHSILSRYEPNLPNMGPLKETWQLLERKDLISKLDSENQKLIVERGSVVRHRLEQLPINYQPLHGDAHYGNLWRTSMGLVWGDFEDVCQGPIEWDLACMVASSQVLGTGSAARVALVSYGAEFDQNLLNLLVVARTIQAIAWALVTFSEPMANPRFCRRLDWLSCQQLKP